MGINTVTRILRRTAALIWCVFSIECLIAEPNDSLYQDLSTRPESEALLALVKDYTHRGLSELSEYVSITERLGDSKLHQSISLLFSGTQDLFNGSIDSAMAHLGLSCNQLDQLEHVPPAIHGIALHNYALAMYSYGAYIEYSSVMLKSIKLLDEAGEIELALMARHNRALVHEVTGRYDLCVIAFDEIINLCMETSNEQLLPALHTNKSRSLIKLGLDSLALVSSTEAVKRLSKYSSIEYAVNAMLAHATALGANGLTDRALDSINAIPRLLSKMKEEGNNLWEDELFIKHHLANAWALSGHPDTALHQLYKLEPEARASKSHMLLQLMYKDIADNHEVLGNMSLAVEYLRKYHHINDSLTDALTLNELNVADMKFKMAETSRVETSMELEREMRHSRLRLLGIIIAALLIVILAVLGLLTMRLRLNNLKHAKEKQQLQFQIAKKQLEERRLKSEVEYKEQRILMEAMKLSEKNTLLTITVDRIKSMSMFGKSEELQSLKQTLERALISKHSWQEFDRIFEELHPSFIRSIETENDMLTDRETRLLCLIKLKLSISECACLMHIEPKSVKMARYRLKQKLKLAEHESLEMFVNKLSNVHVDLM